MRKKYAILGALALIPFLVAATFNRFTPVAGILKGSATTSVTTAATSTDVLGLWSGTCNTTTFLRGDGSCQVAVVTGANPTASLGTAANNGVATTFMRSDASPALNQGILPTWTVKHTFTRVRAATQYGLVTSSADAAMGWVETDAAADNGHWMIDAQGEQLVFTAMNDIETVSTPFMTVDRTGTTVDSIALAGTAVTINGTSVPRFAAARINGSTGALNQGINVSAAVRNSVGNYSVTFSPAFNAQPICSCTNYANVNIVAVIGSTTTTNGNCQTFTGTTAAAVDSSQVMMTCMGT